MSHDQVTLQTNDGPCTVWTFTPSGSGPWPGVIMYMDAFGLRPGMAQMAQQIADAGYVVLLPDLFHRFGPYETLDPVEVFKGDFRAIVGPRMASTDAHKAADDTAAFIAYLDSRADVAGEKIGTVGFCMGGGMAITAAAWYPDRIAAAASFHGGGLASDAPTSPHLQAPKIKAELYVGIADNDHSYPPEMADRFEKALNDAHVKHKSELYEGKSHGWMKPDMPVYDAPAAERGWTELFALYGRTLG
jgi:carboxymethylenebutenolidase